MAEAESLNFVSRWVVSSISLWSLVVLKQQTATISCWWIIKNFCREKGCFCLWLLC